MTQESITNPFIPLTFEAYEGKAMEYRDSQSDETFAALYLPQAVGELTGLIAAEHRDGPYGLKEFERHRRLMKRAIGQVLWSLVALAEDQNCSLEEVALLNLVHLRDGPQFVEGHEGASVWST
jgi:hypothetical protein